jgi:hypothetical protein
MSKIFVSVPILGNPEFKMINSLYQAIFSCKEHQVRLHVTQNDSLISRVRNVHMSIFYDEFKECDYFMSIDSDLEILNCYPTNNIFSKLVSCDKDFVGGLYALKDEKATTPSCSSIALDREGFQFDSGIREMLWLSSGCWMIKRTAVEKMIDSYPELTYDGDDNASGKKIYGLYIPQIFDIDDHGFKFKKYLSEDWAWCERWRRIGGKIYSDTSIALKHIGKKDYALWNVSVGHKKRVQLPEAGFDLEGA